MLEFLNDLKPDDGQPLEVTSSSILAARGPLTLRVPSCSFLFPGHRSELVPSMTFEVTL